MEWLLSWEVCSVVAVFFASSALGFVGLGDYKLAKVFFWIAAIDAFGGICMWGARNGLNPWVRGSLVFLGGGFICLVLSSALHYVEGKQLPLVSPKEEAKDLSSEGFVQFENRNLELPSQFLQAGQQMRMKFAFANKGLVPVYDVQSWGVMMVLNRKVNDIVRTKEVFHQSVATGYEKFKGSGSTLGVGIENFNYAPLNNERLTEEDITNLKNKDWNLYFMAVGAWRNSSEKPNFWIQCEWIEFVDNSLDIAKTYWHTC